jgi:hypothetical protein
MPRPKAELEDGATTARRASESLERATKEFASELTRQNLSQQAGSVSRSQDPLAQRLEAAALSIQGVADQSRALNAQQNQHIDRAAEAIAVRDPQRLDESISQMTRELERLATERGTATSPVDRMANEWQTSVLNNARQVAETVREALQSETKADTYLNPNPPPPERGKKLSNELREQAESARTLYDTNPDPPKNEPSKGTSQAIRASQEMEKIADRLDAAQAKFHQTADSANLTDDQKSMVSQATNAIREQSQAELANSVRALDQERAALEQRIDAAKQPLAPNASTLDAVAWKTAKNGVEATQKQLDHLTATRDLAASMASAMKQEAQLTSNAFGRALSDDFSKTPAVKAVWDAAKAGRPNSPEGFADARESFWRQVNDPKTPQAKAVGKMISTAGYNLGKGSNAPMLKETWDRLKPSAAERIAQQDPELSARLMAADARVNDSKHETLQISDRRASIDHRFPQSKASVLTLEAENLCFTTARENSFKGDKVTTDGLKAVEAIKQSLNRGMTATEANQQIFESEYAAQKVRDEREIKKMMEQEEAKLEKDKKVVWVDDD